jgi:hypothetical protein
LFFALIFLESLKEFELPERQQVQIKGRRKSLAKAECCGRSRSKSTTVGARRSMFLGKHRGNQGVAPADN